MDKLKMIKALVVLVGFFSMHKSQTIFRPNLPLGEYRVITDRLYSCKAAKNYSLQFNYYLSKRTSNITEVKGNMTLLIPFDDTLTLDLHVASWSLTGGWKPNSLVYITKKACSNTKTVLGNSWYSIGKAFKINTTVCPIPAGTYFSSGLDTRAFEDHNFPKVYFYGKYKAAFMVRNAINKEVGCWEHELSLIRPWETPI